MHFETCSVEEFNIYTKAFKEKLVARGAYFYKIKVQNQNYNTQSK